MCPLHENKEFKSLPFSLIKSIRKDASELGTKIVAISGGEPMLHSEIYDIIHEFESNGIKVNLTSNGSLIDEKAALLLAKTKLTSLCVSI
ncbi:MAG: radical SAM protein, partial [Bacteroidales bacterium]